MDLQRKSLFLLDGNSLTHRAFYALPPMNTKDGVPTNAAFGFIRMLLKLIKDEKPDFLAVAFDLKAPTFRHKEFAEYKGTRKKTPDELVPQFDLIKEIVRAFDIPIYSLEGYEADDLLGTLAKAGEKQGHHVTIVTGDRDALQLVSENIRVMYNKKGITDIEDYTLEKVREKYGVDPIQLIEVKALMGDKSDNIPGVPSIGEKTAISLIKEFSTLEEVLANIDKISGKKRKEVLTNHKDDAILSKRLATIMIDVPLDFDFDKCQLTEPDSNKVVEVFKKLNFRTLVDQFTVKEEIDISQIKYKTIEEEVELEKVVSGLRNEKVNLEILLSEEDPMYGEILGIILKGEKEDIYYIPLAKYDNQIPTIVKELLVDGDCSKLIYRAKRQMVALRRYGIELNGLVFDPDIAVYLLKPSEKNPDWWEIVNGYLMITLPDNLSDEENSINSVVLRVSLLNRLEEVLISQMGEAELIHLFEKVEIPLEEVLAEMEFNGIDLDEDYLKELSEELEQRIQKISEKVYEIAGTKFNLNSPKQLGKILFEEMKMPVIKKTKTGYSTNAEVLEELDKIDTTGIISYIHEYRELAKLKSTYVDALPPLVHPETGRIHTYFNQTVTATGRLSSTEPNLQNIPIRTEEGQKIRKAFIAEKGGENILLTADYSQVELRILAYISKDPGLIGAFKENADIHTKTAAEVFELSPEEVDKEHRRRAKAINFGIAYGLSSFGLSRDLGIPVKEAEEYITKYFTRYRGVKEYIDTTIQMAKEQGYVTTLENRRRYLNDIKSRNFHKRSFAERMAINTPIQGTAADIMKIAMIKVYHALKNGNYRSKLLLQVHDELVLEVYPDELESIIELIQKEMENAYSIDVPLLVDIESGSNWLDQSSVL
ncbi:MAG: DNA polymerase I [Halanaerobiales bacterium]|nr:DNA polymerase I [Halanaerobiales bacterium]